MARKWLVAINTTPTTSIHLTQAFQPSTFNTRASNPFQDTIKPSNLSKFHNWEKRSLVISDLREKMIRVLFVALVAWLLQSRFLPPILILKAIVIKARDTKFVVVLVGSKWPGWLRRKLTRFKWLFERGKGLKETRSLWPPQRGVGLQEPNLGKTNSRVSLFICLRFVLPPLSRARLLFLTLTRLVVVLKFVNFRFALFTPPLGDFQWYQVCHNSLYSMHT
jgi:hypothetical protein